MSYVLKYGEGLDQYVREFGLISGEYCFEYNYDRI